MLELKKYGKAELSQMFGSQGTQSLKRKMTRYGIEFETEGRGDALTFEIKRIADPFKVFCITELGFSATTDFHKLKHFYYCFFSDEEFMAMPDEVKAVRMENMDKPVSRQTIANYVSKLEACELINCHTENYIYYFAKGDTQRMVDKAEYSKAWREYWDDIEAGLCSYEAIDNMRFNYKGVARKQAVPQINGIYNEKIEYFYNLICQSIEDESGA